MVLITSRDQWGAHEWAKPVYQRPVTSCVAFVVHYHGGPPRHASGQAMAREVEAIHLDKGWAGVGYSFMVGQDGGVFEGRGWGLVTAACPGLNRTGVHVHVAVGGSQVPTAAALHAVRALYDEACRRARTRLEMTWHAENYPTSCPGPNLIAWVSAGMQDPMPAGPAPKAHTRGKDDDEMPTAREVADAILNTPVPGGELGSDGTPLTYRWALVRTMHAADAANAKIDALTRQLLGDGVS